MATTSATSSTGTDFLTLMGVGAGMDTNALAQKLVDAERAPQEQAINAKVAGVQARISGYGTLRYALSELRTAFQALNDARDFGVVQVTNPQPQAVTVNATAGAQPGVLSVQVERVAQATVLASPAIPAGGTVSWTLTPTIGGTLRSPVTVSGATPQDLADAIGRAGLGLTAQVVDSGGGVHVVVTGTTGAAHAVSLDVRDAAGVAVPFGNLQSARDASLTVNGIAMTRASNTVADAVQGVTLQLTDATTGTARLQLARDTAAIGKAVRALVTAYNQFDEAAQALGSRTAPSDSSDKVTSALAGDNLLASVRSQVRGLLTATASSPGSTLKAVRDVGLSFDRYGRMTLDAARLDKVLANNFEDVVKVFSAGVNDQSVYSPAPGGVAGDMVKRIEGLLRPNGTIAAQSDSASQQLKRYQADLARLQDRMAQVMERYSRQFSAMQDLVTRSNATRSNLTSSFKAMSPSND